MATRLLRLTVCAPLCALWSEASRRVREGWAAPSTVCRERFRASAGCRILALMMISNWKASVAVLLFALAGSGCAFGRKHTYDLATPRLGYSGATWIAIAGHDRRTEVVSGDKAPTFCGLSRGGFGNPFDINTKSDKPLAQDFAGAVQRGLAARGYRVTQVASAPGARPADVAATLARTGAAIGLVVNIAEWKSDTYNGTSLMYDVTLRALDPQGQLLGEARIKGSDELGGSFMDPAGHAEEVVPRAYQAKLEQLLNAPAIVRALQAPAAAPSPPPSESPTQLPAPPAAPAS
jgi:hypothetical protein